MWCIEKIRKSSDSILPRLIFASNCIYLGGWKEMIKWSIWYNESCNFVLIIRQITNSNFWKLPPSAHQSAVTGAGDARAVMGRPMTTTELTTWDQWEIRSREKWGSHLRGQLQLQFLSDCQKRRTQRGIILKLLLLRKCWINPMETLCWSTPPPTPPLVLTPCWTRPRAWTWTLRSPLSPPPVSLGSPAVLCFTPATSSSPTFFLPPVTDPLVFIILGLTTQTVSSPQTCHSTFLRAHTCQGFSVKSYQEIRPQIRINTKINIQVITTPCLESADSRGLHTPAFSFSSLRPNSKKVNTSRDLRDTRFQLDSGSQRHRWKRTSLDLDLLDIILNYIIIDFVFVSRSPFNDFVPG